MKRKKAQFISAEAIYKRTADPSPAQAVANHETKKIAIIKCSRIWNTKE